MKTPIGKWDILFPHKTFLTSLRDLQEGKIGNNSFIYRALVVKIDQIGGQLEQIPRKNPKNSIRARIISEPSPHAFLDNDELPVFWPLFPFDIMPVKENEHIYVIFDGEKKDHGLWISRISEPYEVDDRNITPGIKKYQLNSSEISERDVQDTSKDMGVIKVSEEFQQEIIPKFTARVGDRIIEGSNNTLIVLGRDRISDVSSGEKEQAGCVHIVAGRQKEEDVDFDKDLSIFLVSMKSDADSNLKINAIGNSVSPSPSVVIKSDEIRIVARKGIKIVVEGGDVIVEANNIALGKNANDSAVLGDKLLQILQNTQTIGMLGSVPISAAPFIQALQQCLSKKNKIE